jgi:hypothetical protein
MPCDDCRLVKVSCATLSHTLMKRFLIAGQRGSCDISLSTGNINFFDYQPPLVCLSSVDLHWSINGSLRINRISLGCHQTTALYLLITFLLFNFNTRLTLTIEIILWCRSSFFYSKNNNLISNTFCYVYAFQSLSDVWHSRVENHKVSASLFSLWPHPSYDSWKPLYFVITTNFILVSLLHSLCVGIWDRK